MKILPISLFSVNFIGILDEQGNQVVEYSYDVWGYPLGITGTLADTIGQKNPLRYRGYYFDSETGFYYLNTRYYDPELGRFISADGYVSTGQGMSGHNMFAYCGNNPVNRADPDGEGWGIVVMLGLLAVVLTGCGAKETPKQEPKEEEISIPREKIINARDLNMDTPPDLYNCFGNGIGKEVWDNPVGYEKGDSADKVFKAVKMELGEDNVRRLDSIDAPIAHDEYRVALNCGPTDYHFIRQDEFGWYNKSAGFPGFYVNSSIVNTKTWRTLIFENGQMDVLEPNVGGHIYNCGPIFFAVKVGWDDR